MDRDCAKITAISDRIGSLPPLALTLCLTKIIEGEARRVVYAGHRVTRADSRCYGVRMAQRCNCIFVEGFISHDDFCNSWSTSKRPEAPKTRRRTAIFKIVDFDISLGHTGMYSPIYSHTLDRNLPSMAKKTGFEAPGSESTGRRHLR